MPYDQRQLPQIASCRSNSCLRKNKAFSMPNIFNVIKALMPNRVKDKRNVIILGCHRSGTSSLTGSLEKSGLFLGNVHTANNWNKKGTREHKQAPLLNEAIFKHNGGNWQKPPPPAGMIWLDEHKQMRDEVIASFAGLGRWGFKDPRTLFLLDGWREKMGEVALVGAIRHPAEVMESLRRRNNFAPEKGFDIWTRYNVRLLEVLEEEGGFPVADFSVDSATYIKSLVAIRKYLNLNARPDSEFFTEKLRTSQIPEDVDVPEAALELYKKLREYCVS